MSINVKGFMVSRVSTELANSIVAVKLFLVLRVVLNRLCLILGSKLYLVNVVTGSLA